MRRNTTAAITAIAVVVAMAMSMTGQEDPLPVVTPRAYVAAAIPLAEPTVVLAVEPIRDFEPPTLLEAARGNDYVSFHALYTAATERGEDVSRFATLHELWTYAVTDPIGAFYGAELYERLRDAYPGYAAYIADYRIVDDHGNVFYPTSETRVFLLDRAMTASLPAPLSVALPAARPEVGKAADTTPASSAPPVVVSAEPVPQPAPAPPPVIETPVVVQAPAAGPQIAAATPAPIQPAVPAPTAQPAPAPARSPATRGLLLVLLGLVGIGVLALILRTPRATTTVKIVPNVEPLPEDDIRAAS